MEKLNQHRNKKSEYLTLIYFILSKLKNPDSYRELYIYGQDLLMKEKEQQQEVSEFYN